jgi:hypothetical protein
MNDVLDALAAAPNRDAKVKVLLPVLVKMDIEQIRWLCCIILKGVRVVHIFPVVAWLTRRVAARTCACRDEAGHLGEGRAEGLPHRACPFLRLSVLPLDARVRTTADTRLGVIPRSRAQDAENTFNTCCDLRRVRELALAMSCSLPTQPSDTACSLPQTFERIAPCYPFERFKREDVVVRAPCCRASSCCVLAWCLLA